ncbi:MAG: PAS domain S-box protein, partial [Deltaproteobacteria bacterium]|nr:PAS domain S-box protein [Deltaproteobacteria bacterium]
GADRFIRKPVEPDEFIKIIQGVIRDMEEGRIMPGKPAVEEDKDIFKLYSERLVNKLEKKMLDLEREIAERRRTEEALQESEEKYRTLFEDSRDAIYINTREGGFVDVNQSFLDLFGYTSEEMADLKAENIYANPDDRINFQKEIEEKGFVKGFELKLRKKDGKEMDCLLTSALRRADDGSILGYRGILRDVTEQNKIESQLRQAQRMEAIGTLAGGIAHDFNNLIQAIYGYTQIMMMEKEPGDPDYSRLEAIEKVARRGGDLTEQILLFSRKGEIKLRPVELNLEVKEACKLLERSIPKMINIELHLEEKLKIINADPAQLEQI